ncbi:T9SS type A sorting domain-containing protein [bacterium]|nr:T9SS type A sorting domain-containing protein [bacterium]
MLLGTGQLNAHIITFDEQRYIDVAGVKLTRLGPNTMFDTELGLNYFVAFGQMEIVNFPSGGINNYMMYFTPYISSPFTVDPMGRIVITFDELQQYVRVRVGTDGMPVHPNAYLRVSFFKNTDPNNALFFKDGGGNVEHTDTNVGIKMVIVETKYAENDIFELEFLSFAQAPNPPVLLAPANGQTDVPLDPTLTWQASAGPVPTLYRLNVTTESGQSVFEDDVTGTSFDLGPLAPCTTYMWKLRAKNDAGRSSYSESYSFTTTCEAVVLEVPMAKMAPVIDGNMDPIWYSSCTVPMEKSSLDDDVLTDNWLDTFSSFKMMYDENNYYVFIQAQDDIINTSNANAWEKDSFELYFDGDNSKNDMATGYDGNDRQFRFIYGQTTENTGGAPNAVCRYKDTDHGYNCEIRIPAQDMTFGLVPGHTFGFDIQFNDDDTGVRDHQLKWWAASNDSWHDASLFGTVVTTNYVAASPMYILQAPGAPLIDGVDDDAVWDDIPWFSDNSFVMQNGGAPLSPPFDMNNINEWNDCRFNWKMMWQGSMLYLYADVFDDIIDTSHGDFWMNDGFQIFIDGNNDKSTTTNSSDAEYDPVYTTTPTGDVAFTQTASGWTMEMQMNLGVNPGIMPSVDDLMGLEVSLNDNDGGGRDLWSRWWSDDDMAWSNPSIRGTVKFAGLTVNVEDNQDAVVVQSFHLGQNYPNPFNPTTTIQYQMPKTAFVTLTIHDLLGRTVATLVNEVRGPGEYSVIWNGKGNPSGIYLARLTAGGKIETRKLILQK